MWTSRSTSLCQTPEIRAHNGIKSPTSLMAEDSMVDIFMHEDVLLQIRRGSFEVPPRMWDKQRRQAENMMLWATAIADTHPKSREAGRHTHTHTQSRCSRGCHTGSQWKSGDDLQLCSSCTRAWRRKGAALRAWTACLLPRTQQMKGTADFSQPTELLTLGLSAH